MTINRRRIAYARLALVAVLALTITGSLFAYVSTLYASTTTAESTNSQTPVPISGLSFTLPVKNGTNFNYAVITLDMPNLYLSGTPTTDTALAGEVSVLVSGTTTIAAGKISADIEGPGKLSGDTGRKPMTIVVKIPLISVTQTVQAQWNGVNGATIQSDTFASLFALLTES